MTITRISQSNITALNEQIRVAVVQTIIKVLGPEHTVKITSASLDLADLLPDGKNLSVKISADIYDKTKAP